MTNPVGTPAGFFCLSCTFRKCLNFAFIRPFMETAFKHLTFKYGSVEYQKALALRYLVLRKPLGLQFTETELKKDVDDTHWGTIVNGEVIACLTLMQAVNGRVKMRQMAVLPQWQGKGKGKELLLLAEKNCRLNGAEVVYCHARKVAVPFYEKLGYKIVSDEFTEVDIPHFVMEKKIDIE